MRIIYDDLFYSACLFFIGVVGAAKWLMFLGAVWFLLRVNHLRIALKEPEDMP